MRLYLSHSKLPNNFNFSGSTVSSVGYSYSEFIFSIFSSTSLGGAEQGVSLWSLQQAAEQLKNKN